MACEKVGQIDVQIRTSSEREPPPELHLSGQGRFWGLDIIAFFGTHCQSSMFSDSRPAISKFNSIYWVRVPIPNGSSVWKQKRAISFFAPHRKCSTLNSVFPLPKAFIMSPCLFAMIHQNGKNLKIYLQLRWMVVVPGCSWDDHHLLEHVNYSII